MEKNSSIESIKRKILPILKKNNVVRAGIFGSYARGDQKKNSDVDILVDIREKKFSLFDLIGMELELKKKLKKEVDLLTYKSINSFLKDRILNEEVRIL